MAVHQPDTSRRPARLYPALPRPRIHRRQPAFCRTYRAGQRRHPPRHHHTHHTQPAGFAGARKARQSLFTQPPARRPNPRRRAFRLPCRQCRSRIHTAARIEKPFLKQFKRFSGCLETLPKSSLKPESARTKIQNAQSVIPATNTGSLKSFQAACVGIEQTLVGYEYPTYGA